MFNEDISAFAKLYLERSNYLILDEFHYAKQGGKNLKYLFDFFPDKKIIISGSSTIDITIKAIKYLVGRVVVFELLPFTFDEFLKASSSGLFPLYQELKRRVRMKESLNLTPALTQNFNLLLEEYLLYGGYPEVILNEDREIKKKLLDELYSLYFLKEVRDILGLIDDYKLKLLIKSLSLQIGNLCQLRELSEISSFSLPGLKKHLNFLEKTFVAFFLKPFFTNKRTELVKNPKVYFFDPGFRNTVLDNFLPLEKRGDQGALFENFTALRLRNSFENLNFWRTKSKAEVDFIVAKEDKIIPIEVKTRLQREEISFSFMSFLRKYQPAEGYILSLDFAAVSGLLVLPLLINKMPKDKTT